MDRKQIKKEILDNLKVADSEVVEKVKAELDDLEVTSGINDKNCLEDFYSMWQTYKDQVGDKNDGNSWAMWALGLTSVKPKEDVVFEDGNNKYNWMPPRRTYARVGFPDIDIDFDASRRHEVFQAIEEDVGTPFFAHLGVNQTLQMKDTVTRVIKAGDLANAWFKGEDEWVKQNIRLVREIIDQLPKRKGKLKGKNADGKEIEIKTVEDAYQCFSNFKFYMDKFPFIRKHAKYIEGLVRGFSVHAAGIIISPEPVGDLAPLMKAEIFGTQYVAEDIESMGFIKFDILALAALTTIDKTVKLIKSRYDIDIDPDNIDVTDEGTLELYRTGMLNGVFQCEEKMMQSTMRDIGVDSFDDVMAAIALYRPGPMDNIPSYCNRKRGFEEPNYFHPNIKKATEKILSYTYGLPIYQEQIMQICESLAGFTPVEGYEVIKGIGKKKEELIKKYRDQFIQSRKYNQVEGEVLEEYWDTFIQKFAGYGFNLAHSAAYGYLSFVTGYFKKHYTEEFFTGLLNTFNDMKKHDKIEKYVGDLENFDIEVGERKINKCAVDFEIVQKKDVSLGVMRSVISPSLMCKGVGYNSAVELAKHRPYKDLRDIATKTSSRYVNKETIGALVDAGFFEGYMKQYTKTHRKKLTKDAILNQFELLRNDVAKFASKGIAHQDMFGMIK